jgi:hypothetical protein
VNRALYVVNFIGFQVGWFICIMTGNIFSLAFTSLFLLLHFVLLKKYTPRFYFAKEVRWLAVFFSIGMVIETFFLNTGVLVTSDTENRFLDLFLPPIWLLCLWLLFGTSMRTSLKLLFEKKWIGYLGSLIFAPASYYAGDVLNVTISIGTPLILYLSIIALAWLCTLWLVFIVQHYYFEDIFQ